MILDFFFKSAPPPSPPPPVEEADYTVLSVVVAVLIVTTLIGSTMKPGGMDVPGANLKSWVMLPMRLVVFTIFFSIMFPMMLLVGFLRTLFLRIKVGKPSQILKYGTYPHPKPKAPGGALQCSAHRACAHYPCQQLFIQPLEEAKLRKVLVELAAEDGIAECEISLKFMDEKPNDWPSTGSYDVTSALLKSFPKGRSYLNLLFEPPFGEAKGWKYKLIYHVYNNDPGKPTVVHFGGSAEGWDGSANFNFNKELMRRYVGLAPKKVFAYPVISAEAAAKLDAPSFLYYLAKMPSNVFKNVAGAVWNVVRSASWAGGHGAFVPRIVAMNFSKEESDKLAKGAKALGVAPFACFTHAAIKACKEVLGEQPVNICNQASLQTRAFPVPGQGKERDYVGDWLIGAITKVPPGVFSLEAAQASYKEMLADLDSLGPISQAAFMAKAYGIINSGAAAFQPPPTLNDNAHILDRSLFMNNYGVREMPAESPFDTWNWNAPIWLGVNTICVNRKTTTLVGSSMWSLELIEAIRDNMEATLREIMAKA